MRYAIPVLVVVDAPSAVDADATAKKLAALLKNPMLATLLKGGGIPFLNVEVGSPRTQG
jgi:hypothetical protein